MHGSASTGRAAAQHPAPQASSTRHPNSDIGVWSAGAFAPAYDRDGILAACQHPREPLHLVRDPSGRIGVARGGQVGPAAAGAHPLVGVLPPLFPEWLGDRSFNEAHGTRFAYVTGAMANGIATSDLVIAMARAGMMGFFGAAGLTPARIAEGLDRIEAALGGTQLPWGMNLIHAPNEPVIEAETVDLYLRRKVRRVEAAAYMGLNPMVVRYAYTGVRQLPDGSIHRENFLFAKLSRPEVARRFLAPAPAEILDGLVARGELTADEARLARRLPVAEHVTVEADSGGHTDNRPLPALFPMMVSVRDEMVRTHGYTRPIRIGAAGGLGTPTSVAAAFQMGAAYVLTGSVNQSAIESGLSEYGKQLLTKVGLADVVMAPAADMFELGVKVQVLQRGSMFGVRAQRLYDTYTAYPSMDAIPAPERARLEKEIFQANLDEVWARTEAFFAERDPREVARAHREPKHKMALVFRSYLGRSSKWAIAGDPDRRLDYQIWCGPAMGAFNDWVKGSFLEPAAARTAAQIAFNLLEGAAVVTRAHQLRAAGVAVPAEAFSYSPRPLQ